MHMCICGHKMHTGEYRMSPEKQMMPILEIQFNRERLKEKKAGI